MSREAEVGPVCRGTEGEPQGGAAIIHSGAERDPSDLEGHLDTGISHGDGEDGERVDVNPEEGHSGCLTDPDGEACCLPSEELSGQSPDKAGTLQSDCSSETCIPTPSCRICFQGAEQGQLLNPCRCDGSVRHTHQQCLLKWISERGSWTCELCCYRFHVVAIKMKKPWQWQAITITLVEKVQIIAVFLGSLFLVSSVTWLLWSAFSPNAVWQRRDVLFQICYGMYGFMDLVCIGLIVHEGAAVHKVFKRWRAVNLHWDVQNYDKEADVEESSGGASAAWTRVLAGPSGSPWLPCSPALLCTPPSWSPDPPAVHAPSCGSAAGLAGPQDSEADAGEVVIRVTSV